MSVMDPPRHRAVQAALDLSREFCRGKIIDEAPALRHAVLVARKLVTHVPDAPAVLVAAALLHDSPEFAPAEIGLDAVLDNMVAPGVAGLVRALDMQHQRMDQGHDPELGEHAVTLVAGVDKVIAFRSLATRVRRSADESAFWAKRGALRALLPYFHGWLSLATPVMPQSLTLELVTSLATVDRAIAAASGDG